MLIQEKLSIILLMNIFMTKILPYEKLKTEYESIINTRIRINKNKEFKLDTEI
jgi:hypothetical protein